MISNVVSPANHRLQLVVLIIRCTMHMQFFCRGLGASVRSSELQKAAFHVRPGFQGGALRRLRRVSGDVDIERLRASFLVNSTNK
jgi:hypothetical protein